MHEHMRTAAQSGQRLTNPASVRVCACAQIEQIESIPRPVTMEDGGPVLMDLLWSDPTTNDAVQVWAASARARSSSGVLFVCVWRLW